MEWSLVADKFADIFEGEAHRIRRFLPEADEIVNAALDALNETSLSGRKFPVNTEEGLVEIPVEGLLEMVNQINARQKSAIQAMAEKIGTIVPITESSRSPSRLVGESVDTISVRLEWFILSLGKNDALKVVSLGGLP